MIDERSQTDVEKIPRVALIVPVAGRGDNLEKHLDCLLHQDYPNYFIFFVTQDADDRSVPVIRKVIAGHPNAQHINAGQATACSQKNHNLLQGVLASYPATDIFVFCDIGHSAHPKWLEHLTLPLRSSPSAIISSGYHIVFPKSRSLRQIGRAICVHALYLVRQIPVFTQPWGGAIAIRAHDFRELGVVKLWSTTIVDDVTLADHLQKMRIAVTIPEDADLHTTIDDDSWQSWESWLIRQWAYLKFVFPKLWLVAGATGLAFTLLVCLCIFTIVTAGLRFLPDQYLSFSAVFLTTIAACSLIFRHCHPSPGSIWLWYPAFLAALFMAGWCHCRLWFSNSLTWAGITYKVASGGKVLQIIRPQEPGKQGNE
jgi:ceramide glucosyltransferase